MGTERHAGYRCPTHGRIGFAIIVVGSVTYCAANGCPRAVKCLTPQRNLFKLARLLEKKPRRPAKSRWTRWLQRMGT